MCSYIYGGVAVGNATNPISMETMHRCTEDVRATGWQGPTQHGLRYKDLAKALKGKKRVPAMVEGFGSQEAWDTFQRNLALRLPHDF